MRTFFTVVGLILVGVAAQAQTETLAGQSGGGGFGGPVMELSRITGVTGVTVGGAGAAVFGNVFFGGFGQGAGFGSAMLDEIPYDVSLGVGGLWLGYTYRQQKLVHPFASLKFGWGGIHLRPEDDQDNALTSYSRRVTVVQPEAGVEINMTRWFRLALTGGCRFTNSVRNLPGNLDTGDFNSFTGGLVFRFGGFPD